MNVEATISQHGGVGRSFELRVLHLQVLIVVIWKGREGS